MVLVALLGFDRFGWDLGLTVLGLGFRDGTIYLPQRDSTVLGFGIDVKPNPPASFFNPVRVRVQPNPLLVRAALDLTFLFFSNRLPVLDLKP